MHMALCPLWVRSARSPSSLCLGLQAPLVWVAIICGDPQTRCLWSALCALREIRLAPEVGGQLAAIKVQKGALVSAGDVVAELSALELNAAVGQARAALAEAVALRDHVYAGVRDEEITSLAAEIAKSKARLEYKQIQLTRTSELAGDDYATQQGLDEAQKDVASARADVAEAEANYTAATAGPTKEELAIADAGVGNLRAWRA